MPDLPSTSGVRGLLNNPDFFKDPGDLIAVAEALFAATADQVNGVTRKFIDAAQTRLAQLAKLNKVGTQLPLLAHVDSTTLALGPDRASSDALAADLEAAGVSLTTAQSYYISSVTTDADGAVTATQANHIATAGQKAAAEAGTLVSSDANGNEVRFVANSGGGGTTYSLHKSETVLTASVANVDAAIADVETLTAPLLETVAADILTVNAFLAEKRPLKDNRQFTEARNNEGKSVDNRLTEYLALAKVATQRAQEKRDESKAPARAAN